MRILLFIITAFFFQHCTTKSGETNSNSINKEEDTALQTSTLLKTEKKIDTLAIVRKTNSVPGDIDTTAIRKLTEPLQAMAAFYAAMGGTLCNGENCQLTTALGLGKQGSEQHKQLISNFFPNDKVAEMVVKQDCYLRPSGASSFSDFAYITIINLGDTVKVDYQLLSYNRGKSEWTNGPDSYLFTNNKFVKLKRNLWKFADEEQ